MSTGPFGVRSCAISGPKLPYGFGFASAWTAESTLATLMRIVAFRVAGADTAAAASGRCARNNAAKTLQAASTGNHLQRFFVQLIGSERVGVRGDERDVSRIARAAERSANGAAQVVHQHEVILRRPRRV